MAENQNKKQPKTMDSIKKGFEYAADLTSLKFKLGKAKCKRKDAYARLGELSYTKYRPRATDIPEDIEKAISAVMDEINILNHEIIELELRIKLLKAGA